jgi:hypothetical protein
MNAQVMKAAFPKVEQVFPSSDLLPENLLRFYVRFSTSMQRGWAEENIVLLGPDGRPAPDVLYRPPVELWDRSLRHLTILLDPGRLKRGVGPNRELGSPLKTGHEYTLVINSGMIGGTGHALREGFCKRFLVTEPVREAVAIEDWKVVLPDTRSHQPLALFFPKPLDWGMLWNGIIIESDGDQQIAGRISIDQEERRWSFTPTSPWTPGAYVVRIKPNLEDICGNNLLGAFDKSLNSAAYPASETPNSSLPFQLV